MLAGVILAGGQSRRMGNGNKSLLPFGNETLVERQVRRMRNICDEMLIVANESAVYRTIFGDTVRVIPDRFPGQGPLAGMHAAFSAARCSVLWVVGCDMPFLSSEAAAAMLEHGMGEGVDAVIPNIGGRDHPLHGIYGRECRTALADRLEQGMCKVGTWLELLHMNRVNEDFFKTKGIGSRFVTNVNTPEQYRLALQQMEEE